MSVRQLPDGPNYDIESLKQGSGPVHHICIGTDSRCGIVVPRRHDQADDEDTDVVCILKCKGTEVMVTDPVGKPALNLVTLNEGRATLYPGVILNVNDTMFVACGTDPKQAPHVIGSNMPEIVNHGLSIHGNRSRLAKALGVPTSTFHNWLEGGRFGIAVVVCALVGVVFWSVSETSSSDPTSTERPALLPMSSSAPPQQSSIQDELQPETQPALHSMVLDSIQQEPGDLVHKEQSSRRSASQDAATVGNAPTNTHSHKRQRRKRKARAFRQKSHQHIREAETTRELDDVVLDRKPQTTGGRVRAPFQFGGKISNPAEARP